MVGDGGGIKRDKDVENGGAMLRKKTTKAFEQELEKLINKHSMENTVDMPDFILASMLCSMIEAMGPSLKKNLNWHGCDSTCHPAPSTEKANDAVPAMEEMEELC